MSTEPPLFATLHLLTISQQLVSIQSLLSKMVFRKKNYGTVTVYEEEPQQPDDLIDDFSDLGITPKGHIGDIDMLSKRQLENAALSTVNEGKEATGRALRLALEARDIGANTATQMKGQTEQLEKMADDIEVVHDCLDKSEHIIDKMSKPKILRLFQKKKQMGKGLDKVRAGKGEIEERERRRDMGLGAIDLGNIGSEDDVDIDNDREELFDGITVTDHKPRGFGFRKKKSPAQVRIRAVRDNYSDYSKPVADVIRQQDEDLDQISNVLGDMKNLAGAMHNELEYQNAIITEVNGFAAETSRRTKHNANKISKIK